jgi:ABC-type phosphate/phosphonate transport system substrate-binding protein
MNRCHKKPLFTKAQVEELLGVPVVQTFPNDYNGINKAMTAGKWIDQESEIGEMCTEFAKALMEKKNIAKEPKKFLEFLSTPNRLLAPTKS